MGELKAREDLLGQAARGRTKGKAESPLGQVGQEEVLGDRKVGKKAQFLKGRCHAGRAGFQDRARTVVLAADAHHATVGLHDTAERLD